MIGHLVTGKVLAAAVLAGLAAAGSDHGRVVSAEAKQQAAGAAKPPSLASPSATPTP